MSRKSSSRRDPDAQAAPNPIARALPSLIGVAAVVAGTVYLFRSTTPKPVSDQASSPFKPTIVNSAPAPGPAPEKMVWIPGGEFSMGSEDPTTCACEGAGHDPMPDA